LDSQSAQLQRSRHAELHLTIVLARLTPRARRKSNRRPEIDEQLSLVAAADILAITPRQMWRTRRATSAKGCRQ
jgi:hypothetical protein